MSSHRNAAVATSPYTPVGVRHNLPHQLSTFVGRSRELTARRPLLSAHRLVTLTGPGGCGKTRFGLEVAAQLCDAFPVGIWFVELAALMSADLVPRALAAVLEVQEQPDRALADTLAEQLAPQQPARCAVPPAPCPRPG